MLYNVKEEMRLKILYIFCFILIALNMQASKAVRFYNDITLNDGRVVSATLVGDENMHFYKSSDGEIILYNLEGDYYYSASKEEIDSLKNIYDNLEQQNLKQFKAMSSSITSTDNNGRLTGFHLFPSNGTPKVLVLMVEFSDVSFTFSSSDLDKVFNSTEMTTDIKVNNIISKSQGSVAEYFNHCSGGQFRPQFDIYGTFKVNNTAAYYSTNEISLIKEVCEAAKDDVDFTEYDQDNDGYVDLLYILYAGYGATWGNTGTIWPKVKYNTSSFCTVDGKKVHRACMSNELAFTPQIIENKFNNEKQISGIGIVCHEFCHAMGITDFYPNQGTWSNKSWYDNQSMEDWSLMDGGENKHNGCLPTPLNAFERYLFGWIDVIQVLDEPTKVVLTPLKDGGQPYKILGNDENEYWIIEAIPSDNEWYMFFKTYTGTGMIVYHINTNIKNFSGLTMVNGTHGNPGITIVPADGRLIGYYNTDETSKTYHASMLGDPFPGTQKVTTLTDYWAKNGTIDKPINDIVQNDDYSVSFRFMYTLGDVNGDGVINGTDIQSIINFIVSDQYDIRADVNEDGLVNGTDIQEIINIIVHAQ